MESNAGELTAAQIFGAIGWVFGIVVLLTKHFDALIKAGPSFQKAWKYLQQKWFSQAIFRSDVLKKLEVLQLQGNEIAKEVKYNGGTSLKDTVRRLEQGQTEVMRKIEHLRALREISDKYDARMNFKYDPEQGVTFISESFLNAFACKESDVVWYAFADLIHPDDREEMWAKWQRACEKKTPFQDTQRIRDGIGNYLECDVRAVPIVIDGVIKEFKGIIEIIYKN